MATLGIAASALIFCVHSASAGPKKTRAALIRVSTAKLRSGPGTQHKATALLDEGRSARVIARDGAWLKVRLGTGKVGWLRRDLLVISKKATRDPDAARQESASRPKRKPVRIARQEKPKAVQVAKKKKKETAPKAAPRVAQARLRSPRPQATPAARRPESVPSMELVLETGRIPEAASGSSTPERDAQATPREAVRVAQATESSETLPRRNSPRGQRLARRALAFRGMPYRTGAVGAGAFDCSGFVRYLYAREGRSLPRTAAEQFSAGAAVDRGDLRPGDLVFFRNTYKRGISHVGMYIGNGRFVHASGHGRGVRIDSLSKDYYINHWAGARRPR